MNLTTQKRIMNNEMITTTEGRLLQSALGNATDYSTWIKRKVADAFLNEGIDYIKVFHKSVENLEGGRPSSEYHLSSESCKAIAMMEKTPLGKQVRDYYISLETNNKPQTMKEWAISVIKYEEEKEALILENQQKTEVIDHKKDITDEGDNYYSVKRVKAINPDTVISGVRLSKGCSELNVPAKQMFTHWDINNPVSYHASVWFHVYPNINLPE